MKNSEHSQKNGKNSKSQSELFRCHGKCGQELSKSNFHPRKGKGRPVQYICKKCLKDLYTSRYKKAYRKEKLQEACDKITSDAPVATTVRKFNNYLKFILEQQLRLFYFLQINTVPGRVKSATIIRDTLFEFGEALARFHDRLQNIVRNECNELNYKNGIAITSAFEILGIPVDSEFEVIKEAYLTKAKQAHPDHGGSVEDMQIINSAFDILKRNADET